MDRKGLPESGAEDRNLSERKKMILRAIVEAYIAAGEPVGSKYLTGAGNISLSSATIRNEMAELEDMGYLEQPHTSAGRIPSERGYRFYVDSLMQNYILTANELKELNNLVKVKASELDGILERAGKLMSVLTNYTSVMVKPKINSLVVMQYKIIRVDADSFLLLMITAKENVITKYIHSKRELDDTSLTLLETALNTTLRGVCSDEITLPVMMELQNRLGGCEDLLPAVMKCIYEAFNNTEGGDIRVEGMNRLLEYPEFTDLNQLRSLLGLMERKDDILNVVSNSDANAVNIYIGNENEVDIMRHSSFIFRTINSGDRVLGAIGVIGPCRMDYSKVVTTVEYLAKQISGMVEQEQGSAELPGIASGSTNDAGSAGEKPGSAE